MADAKITFIGGGNMATSIIGGLVAQGYSAQAIGVCDPLPENRDQLARQFGVNVFSDNSAGVADAEAIILAVKPQVMAQVCRQLAPHLQHQPLIISIAAGIDIAHLDQWLGNQLAIVRCMPNTPSLVRLGASALYANPLTAPAQRKLAEQIMAAVGIVEWLTEESLIDAVTAISGSGPAYFFLFMESMVAAGVELGLPEATATRLAIQTCLGAGSLAQQSDVDLAELRRRVSSPGGTTLQALESFNHNQLPAIVAQAMQAARDRSIEMAKELDSSQ